MCFLEKPLLPETCSSLRSLARKCIDIRSEIVTILILKIHLIVSIKLDFIFKTNSTDEKINSLNLFIAIISRHFGQADLAD